MSITNPLKPYELIFENRPQYLYAYVRGEKDSYEISRQFWTEIAHECKKLKYKKLLVDEDLAEEISTLSEVFQGASERPQMGLTGVKIAFLDRHVDHVEQNKFGEMVSTNRGLLCKVFYDLTEAEEWLLSY